MTELNGKTAVVALGGNAISQPEEEDTIANQFRNTRVSLDGIVQLIKAGYKLVISHGNGPQVGNAILRVEIARGKAPILPLGICVADTEGGMGYMIEQSLQNRLKKEGVKRDVVTIISQVVVDKDDPSIADPSKYVGQFYSEEDAKRYAKERGWAVKADGKRGWRRVVASPIPKTVVNAETIKDLVEKGRVVIAVGGGGVPAYYDDDGNLEGLDAVIDKDLASAVLANEIGAEILMILTSVEQVYINYGEDNEEALGTIPVSTVQKYLEEGHFPPGSMGPKIKSAIKFIKEGGKQVIITSFENAAVALKDDVGTKIVPD